MGIDVAYVFQHNKVMYDKPLANIILNNQRLKAFRLRSEISQISLSLFPLVLEALDKTGKKKNNERILL